jgi:prepilin-type N-terminal cleavage/methylation domain-containing protein
MVPCAGARVRAGSIRFRPHRRTDMRRANAFTLIELLTVMAIIALLVGLLMPALQSARTAALANACQSQIKQVHQSFLVLARDHDGALPTPGLVNRLPDPQLQRHVAGRGPEDLQANTSEAMYSLCIMQGLFPAEILYAPTEPSPYVAVKSDYFFDGYNPLADFYWDFQPLTKAPPPNAPPGYVHFRTRHDRTKHGANELLCNASFAHTPIAGDRKKVEWRDTANSQWPVLGDRGVRRGSELPADYGASVTLETHGGRKQWAGHVCFSDNHVELLQTFYPPGINYRAPQTGLMEPDNIFRNDLACGEDDATTGSDAVLALVSRIHGAAATAMVCEWD